MNALPNITPYAVYMLINKRLENAGSDKRVTPQMMYGYAKKGQLKDAVLEGYEKVTLDGTIAKAFIDKYVANVLANIGSSKIDYDELAKQFA